MKLRSPAVAAVLTALAAALTAPSALAAPGIAYVAKNGRPAVTSTDGRIQRTLSSSPAVSVATADDGTIALVRPGGTVDRVDQFGRARGGPLATPAGLPVRRVALSLGSGAAPFLLEADGLSSAVDPDTALGPAGLCASFSCLGSAGEPRWLPGGRAWAAVTADGSWIRIADGTGAGAEQFNWLGHGEEEIDLVSFDVSRKGWRVLIEARPQGRRSQETTLLLWRGRGRQPDGVGDSVCGRTEWARGTARPRWSPDGSRFLWSDRAGIYVSPAPKADADGFCVLRPRLVVPGGRLGEWTRERVRAAP